MLITTEQLAGHLDDSEWVVLDTRHDLMDPAKGRKAYEAGHIPGAYFISVDDDLSGAKTGKTGRHPLPELAAFAARMNESGVAPGSQVVIYDDVLGNFAVRLWWMLRWLGHDRVALLDGGFPLWVQEGRPTTTMAPPARAGSFVPRPRLGATVDVHFVERHRQDPAVKLIDARAAERFRGEQEPIDPIAGHVPGAVNRFWKENLLKDGRFKTPSQLRSEYKAFLGAADPPQVVHMCGSGVTACHNIFAMEVAGLPGGRLPRIVERVDRGSFPAGGESLLMFPMRRALPALCLACGLAAADDVLVPPPSLVLEGVPPIAGDIATKIRPYDKFRSHGLMSWHPAQREVLVRRRLGTTTQAHRVSAPGLTPLPLTDLPDTVSGASYQPTHGDYFVFSMAEGGNEVFRLHRFDLGSGAVTPLSAEGRALIGAWNRKGDRLVFTTAMIDRNNPERIARTTLHIIDPARPQTLRTLAKWEGGRWSSFRFSEDGKRLAFLEVVSTNERHVWVMDVASGKKRRVSTPSRDQPVAYSDPWFSRDGRGLFLASDRGSEFRRLVLLDLATGKERVLTAHLRHDVEDMEISFDVGLIAFATNEAGAHVLRFMDLRTLKELPRPALVSGVIGGLAWRRNSSEIGFHITSARSAGDVFSYDQKEHRLTRWTNGNNPEVNTSEFAEPRVVKWSSFDGLEITGLHYHPPARFNGKRPVMVSIHGGPASQARPTFIGRNNYLVNELGIAIIYPNVRGSQGFGKTFLKLDDGMKREDSVKDLGTLLDWIAHQPDLDAARVIVSGGSYGGYVSLASAVHFADRIAGAISVAGISNFVTFLERTESYRRDLRRAEYGDERDPAMRVFLEAIAPINHAGKIAKPLLVVQGLNDPRVPYTEAEQIVAALKKRGTPAWFVFAKDEGHGFVKKPNADYLFYATVEFARRTLLP